MRNMIVFLEPSDGTSTSEKIVPELSTLGDDDDEKDEVKDKPTNKLKKILIKNKELMIPKIVRIKIII